MTESNKRKDEGTAVTRKYKKRRYASGEEDWGSIGVSRDDSISFLYSGIEGVRKKTGPLGGTPKSRTVRTEFVEAATKNMKITSWAQPVENEKDVGQRGPLPLPGALRELAPVELRAIELDVKRLGILPIEWGGGVYVKNVDDVKNCAKNDGSEMVVKKKKVWTKLNNGLFGWRVKVVAKRRSKNTTLYESEQKPPSARAKGGVPITKDLFTEQ